MYCFNFFTNQLWQHLISYNCFKNIKMCLSEAAVLKCRSSHFLSEGEGSKKFEDWGGKGGGVKNFRTGGLPIRGGGTFAGGYFYVSWATHSTKAIQNLM